MKNWVRLQQLVILIVILSSCQFQHLLKGTDTEKKYETAVELYNKKDYSRALQLFDQLMGVMKATDKAQKIYYLYSYCYYGEKDYTMASYYFKRYTSNFPNTKETEECAYMSAYCNYMNSPDYGLDQTSTYDAIKDLQLFVNSYPASTKVPECNDLIDKLRVKLEYKDYRIAKLYYKMDDFAAAVRTLDDILKDYPETTHKEEIMMLIIRSYQKYARESVEDRKKDRYTKAIVAYTDFVQQFPQSKFLPEARDMKEKAEKEIALIISREKLVQSKNIKK